MTDNQLNALSIDLEDWYHPELVRSHVPAVEQIGQIEEATRPLLSLLRLCGGKATFFVVGEVAREHPDLVQEIYEDGHEIACHGMTHRPLWALTPGDFQHELTEFSATIESIIGEGAIVGFRAPSFSLDNSTRWALHVLQSYGYRYDSSIFGAKTPLYGVTNCPLTCYRPSAMDVCRHDPNQSLIEAPVTIHQIGRWRVPVAGGVYLRMLPLWLLRKVWRRVQQERPLVIYLHPWETFSGTPRCRLPPPATLCTYYDLKGTLRKLERLLCSFRFGPVRAVVARWQAADEGSS